MLKALIVDDEYLVRTGLRHTIEWEDYGIEIIGEASNGIEGLELALLHHPEIIVTDIRMPYMNGLEFLEKIKEHQLECRTIVLSGYDEFQYAQEAVRLGASHYLLKPIHIDELIQTLQQVGEYIQQTQTERKKYEQLKLETPAFSSQFWLDLLFGSTLNRQTIDEKLQLFNIGIANNIMLTIGVVSFANHTADIGTINSQLLMIEQQIDHILRSFSFSYSKVIRSAPAEWAIIAAGNDAMVDMAAKFHEASNHIILTLAEQLHISATIGFANANHIYSDLHPVFLQAQEAANVANMRQNKVQFAAANDLSGIRREVKDALSYIRIHYARNITADMVAASVHISPTHLMHLFRKDLNKTFYECLTEFRIEEAKRLLQYSTLRVYEVGINVGFGDSKYFSQIFKKMTGMSPSDYAKKYR